MATREELQSVCDITFDFLTSKGFESWAVRQNRPAVRPRLRLTLRQGHAHSLTGSVSVPRWAAHERGDTYAVYYAIHETCHLFQTGHGADFRRIERCALEAWGILIQYARAYPASLHSLNGETLYRKKPRQAP